jgi:hypothetical protein
MPGGDHAALNQSQTEEVNLSESKPMSKMFRWRPKMAVVRRLCFMVPLALTVVTGMFVGTAQQSPANPGVSFLGSGGGVQGTVFLRVPDGATGRPVLLPDFEVVLRNLATEESSLPVKADFFGRFVFSTQKPGAYELRWKAQRGWQDGVFGKKIVITSGDEYVGGIEIKPQVGRGLLVGQVRRADGGASWVYEEFFGVSETAQVTALDASGNQVAEAVRANAGGQFAIAGLPQIPLQVRATIEAAVATQTVPVSALSFGGPALPATLTLNQRPPQIFSVVAKLNQNAVVEVAPGATVTVAVNARGFNQNALKFDWRIGEGMGTLKPAGALADWTLPGVPGFYKAHVMVSDGFGGYATGSVSLLVGMSQGALAGQPLARAEAAASNTGPGPVIHSASLNASDPSPTPPPNPSFLNLKGPGSPDGANKYYAAVDPNGLRTTLGDWWHQNGFDRNTGQAAGQVRTSYLNFNDLGSGRDMYLLQHADGTVSAYVTNYVDTDPSGNPKFDQTLSYADSALAQDPNRRAATVCMEWSTVEGSPSPAPKVVKFFVYDPPSKGGARLPNLNLGPGDRFIPELCLNCHGGDNSGQADLKASFREFDTATFRYPAGRPAPNAAEMTAFKHQNFIVRGTDPTLSTQAIKDLINGWYHWNNIRDIPVQIPVNGGVLYIDPHPGNPAEDNSFFPPGWANTMNDMNIQMLYTGVVAKSCRTCHVAFSNNNNKGHYPNQQQLRIDWTTSQQFLTDIFTGSYVHTGLMPHAPITFKNFWNDSDEVTLFYSRFP